MSCPHNRGGTAGTQRAPPRPPYNLCRSHCSPLCWPPWGAPSSCSRWVLWGCCWRWVLLAQGALWGWEVAVGEHYGVWGLLGVPPSCPRCPWDPPTLSWGVGIHRLLPGGLGSVSFRWLWRWGSGWGGGGGRGGLWAEAAP